MADKPDIGIAVPKVLLPNASVDPQKWAVIACDQFTSEPEYWQKVEQNVGSAPSTFRMILPEVYLHESDLDARIEATQSTMQAYLDQGFLKPYEGFVLVERHLGNKTQTGLVVALDLEAYDYNKGSQTLVRATEGTILDRLPPRMKVREGAILEMPHILVLYDDPEGFVLRSLLQNKNSLEVLYDFELMEGSGHLKGMLVNDPDQIQVIKNGLAKLIEPDYYAHRYNISGSQNPLLYAMGDGNHSLATAKALWEKIKNEVGPDHPARYALVELVNLHDTSLAFEPIHRVLFNADPALLESLRVDLGPAVTITNANDFFEMTEMVTGAELLHQRFGAINADGYQVFDLAQPRHNLAVGSLQEVLDAYLKENPQVKIDYVHGDDVVDRLGREPGNLAFYLPGIAKDNFFKSIIMDGALPRKTFSMGHAKDKRFYMECRKIVP